MKVNFILKIQMNTTNEAVKPLPNYRATHLQNYSEQIYIIRYLQQITVCHCNLSWTYWPPRHNWNILDVFWQLRLTLMYGPHSKDKWICTCDRSTVTDSVYAHLLIFFVFKVSHQSVIQKNWQESKYLWPNSKFLNYFLLGQYWI